MDSTKITQWMRAVEITLREITFAISLGQSLPANAESFNLIRAGLDDMTEIRQEIEHPPTR